jgi:hypothetical protein
MDKISLPREACILSRFYFLEFQIPTAIETVILALLYVEDQCNYISNKKNKKKKL